MNEVSVRFEILHIDDDIISFVTVVVATAARKKLFFLLDSSSSSTFIYEDSSETHEKQKEKNKRQLLNEALKNIEHEKLSVQLDLIAQHINFLHCENGNLKYRLDNMKLKMIHEVASKSDIAKLQDENKVFQSTLENFFAKLITQIREIKKSTVSKTSSLVDVNSTAKVAKKISKKVSLRIDFALQSSLISHSSLILSTRNAYVFSIQNARNQLSHRWNDDFDDRTQRFHRDDYELNRERNKNRLRSFSKLSSNSKSTHLQDVSIVAAIKQKKFKTSDMNYFYSDLSKKIHVSSDYVVSEKNIFYRDVYMFTQQMKRIAAIKNVNSKLYLYFREFFMM